MFSRRQPRPGPVHDAGFSGYVSSRWQRSQPRSVRMISLQRSRLVLVCLPGPCSECVVCHLPCPPFHLYYWEMRCSSTSVDIQLVITLTVDLRCRGRMGHERRKERPPWAAGASL